MQSVTFIANLTFCSLFLFLCYGAPPKEGNQSSSTKQKYTREEDEFIINFVKSYPTKPKPLFGNKMWIEAAQVLNEMRKSDPSHFPQERSYGGLRSRFTRQIQKSGKKGEDNNANKTGYEELMDEENIMHSYTVAEDGFITTELLKSSFTNVDSISAWQKIKAKHDSKVQSNTAGFDRNRSVLSLKTRFGVLLMEDRVPPALKKKCLEHFSKRKGKTSHAKAAGEEDVITTDMVNELVAAPYYIDFSMIEHKVRQQYYNNV